MAEETAGAEATETKPVAPKRDERAITEREPIRHFPSSIQHWISILGGPVTWLAHFLVVYFVADYACTGLIYGTTESLSGSQLKVVVMVVTVVAIVISLLLAQRAYRTIGSGLEGFTGWVGMVLALGGIPMMLAIGLPVLWLGPC